MTNPRSCGRTKEGQLTLSWRTGCRILYLHGRKQGGVSQEKGEGSVLTGRGTSLGEGLEVREKEMTSSTEDVRSTADCRRAGRMRLTV
jgi:hypothetical protein